MRSCQIRVTIERKEEVKKDIEVMTTSLIFRKLNKWIFGINIENIQRLGTEYNL